MLNLELLHYIVGGDKSRASFSYLLSKREQVGNTDETIYYVSIQLPPKLPMKWLSTWVFRSGIISQFELFLSDKMDVLVLYIYVIKLQGFLISCKHRINRILNVGYIKI